MSPTAGLARIPAPVRVLAIAAILVASIATWATMAKSSGQVLRVAPGGGGNCVSSPCGDLVTAVRAARSGDVIEMASGTYGDQTISGASGASGWAENVTVRPAAGAKVTTGSIRSHVPNVTFLDFTVNGIVYLYPEADGSMVMRLALDYAYVTGADNTTWAGNSITPPPGQDGIQLKALNGDNADNTSLLMNVIGPGYRVGTSHTDCIQLLGAHDTVIVGNRIYECANTGIQIGSGAGGTVDGVLIDRNVIDECHPQRDECPGYHTIIVGSAVADSVRIVGNTLNGSVGIAGTTGGVPIISGNTAVELPCSPKTDWNVVQANPCGPNDQLASEATPVTPPPVPPTTPPTTAPATTVPTTVATTVPTTAPPVTAPPKLPPPPQLPPSNPVGDVTQTFVARVHSKAPSASFDFDSGAGTAHIELSVRGAYRDRAWATVQLVDSSGRVLATALSGPTPTATLQASIPAPGRYRVVVTSKPGEVNLAVTHPG
jgi:Right handed beta helix region